MQHPGPYERPAGLVPGPRSGGGLRYFDGRNWTPHTSYPPSYAPPGYGQPPWKGARLGRPAYGPGALASPGKRLAARLLDGLVMAPLTILFMIVGFVLVIRHAGPIFTTTTGSSDGAPGPGFWWLYAVFFLTLFASGVATLLYESLMTLRYGRTLGKRWMRIRPLRLDGSPLTAGQAFSRAGLSMLAGLASGVFYIGILDPLWCLWDPDRQCVHDKIVGTIVVDD